MSAGIFHSAEHYSEYDKDSDDQMPPSTTMADPRQGADQLALPQPGDDQQQGAHPMTMVTSNVGFPSPTCDPYAPFPAESMYSAPLLSKPQSLPYQLQSLPQTLPSAASHSNYGESNLKCSSNAAPTAVSSDEARVSLPSREGSSGEHSSRPVTGAREECVVSVPISAAGNAVRYSSEDIDRTVFEDVQVKAPPSNDRSIG